MGRCSFEQLRTDFETRTLRETPACLFLTVRLCGPQLLALGGALQPPSGERCLPVDSEHSFKVAGVIGISPYWWKTLKLCEVFTCGTKTYPLKSSSS